MQCIKLLAVMVKLELKTYEEQKLWRTMQKELKKRDSFQVKQTYFPHNMDTWRETKKTIERTYRAEIESLQTARKELEEYHAMHEAAETLLLLKKREEYKQINKARKCQNKTTPVVENKTVRRSTRIANKK